MSFMWVDVASALYERNALHILPRIGRTQEERLRAAKELHSRGHGFGMAIGLNDSEEFIEALLNAGDKHLYTLSVDVAHGASVAVAEYMHMLRYSFGIDSGLIVGNVGSVAGTRFLAKMATVLGFKHISIKVGIGPGAACTTRIKTGVGVGQVSALQAILSALDDQKLEYTRTTIIADGGIEKPADFVKAFAAGANFVMAGKYLISEEFDGEFEYVQLDKNLPEKTRVFKYYGMASKEAKAGSDEYVEGAVLYIPAKEKRHIADAVESLEYGLRSAMTYVDAQNLTAFYNNAYMIRNSIAATREGEPRG